MDFEIADRKLISFWFSLVMVGVILVGAERLGWSQPIWQVTERVTVPVKSMIWSEYDGLKRYLSWWQYWRQGQQELVRLKQVLSGEAGQVSELVELREENQRLRKLLGADFPSDWKFLPAEVLKYSGGEMVIDRGEKQGVQVGMMVVAAPGAGSNLGILVGKVVRIHPQQAWVETIDNQDLRLEVDIADQDSGKRIGEGLLVWESGRLKITKLLPGETVRAGNVVMTGSNQGFDVENGEGWLAGIPVGVINQVSFEKETDVYQQAVVSWLVEKSGLDQVFVVTGW